jgi:hypothetical protein
MLKFFSGIILVISLCVNAENLPLNPGEVAVDPGGRGAWSFECSDNCKMKPFPKYDGGGFGFSLYKDGVAGAGFTFKNFTPPLNCRGFDKLIVFMNVSGSVPVELYLVVKTDKGIFSGKRTIKDIENDLYKVHPFMDLSAGIKGAEKIFSIKIGCRMLERKRGSVSVPVYRIILRNDSEYKSCMKHFERFAGMKWEGLLKDESYQPQFKPLYSLLYDDKQLQEFRREYASALKARAKALKLHAPETAIGPNINPAREEFQKRVPDKGVNFFNYETANYGILTKNKKLLRLAARQLLSLCAVENWGDGAYPRPSGEVVKTAFGEGRYGLDAALMLDWTGEMLTPKGREWALNCLVMKSFAPVTYSEWSRPYCFNSNQGPTFMVAKIAALLCAEKEWKRVAPYTALAVKELNEAMDFLFASDGSFMESKAYFSATIFRAIMSYQMIASTRKEKLSNVIPDNLKKSGAYAQVIISTCKNPQRRILSIGQSRNWHNFFPRAVAFMAAVVPGSLWVNLFHEIDRKKIESRMNSIQGMSMWLLVNSANKSKKGKEKNFVLLKKCGLTSSMRRKDGKKTKIVMVGDAENMNKKHHDVGSFVLEFAGDIYAMDMPVYSGLFTDAQYHNMLAPFNAKGQFFNSMHFTDKTIYRNAKIRNSMCPRSKGDENGFAAEVDASGSWKDEYFKKWKRKIDSPDPNKIIISDEYQLGGKAAGIASIWNTYLPCEVKRNVIIIHGEYGSLCKITVPENCEICLDKFSPGRGVLKGMDLPLKHKCTRIMIKKMCKKGEKGCLELNVELVNPST